MKMPCSPAGDAAGSIGRLDLESGSFLGSALGPRCLKIIFEDGLLLQGTPYHAGHTIMQDGTKCVQCHALDKSPTAGDRQISKLVSDHARD